MDSGRATKFPPNPQPLSPINRERGVGKICRALVLLLIFSSCAPAIPTATPIPPKITARPTDLGAALVKAPAFPSLSYGIQAFLWWNAPLRSLDLEHVRLMNFGYVKQIFNWADIQPDPKLPYDWSRADAVVNEVAYRGLRLIARVEKAPDWAMRSTIKAGAPPFDLSAWGTFCHDLAAHYTGKIAGYQVWNEPNLAREWFKQAPDPRGYVSLLSACDTQIKAADPAAIVISAGLAPTGTSNDQAMPDDRFLQQMYDAGLAKACDVIGLNAPGYKSAPDTDPGDPALDGQRWQSFRHVEDMRAIQVANGDGSKQIAILEMGWTLDKVHPDYAWFAVTEAQQAQYLVGAYAYAAAHWRPWVGLMTTIYLPDPSWTEADEQYWWAISTPGYTPHMRQAYVDLANMAKISGEHTIPARLPGVPNQTPLPAPTVTVKPT